jgi:hypothetical protein
MVKRERIILCNNKENKESADNFPVAKSGVSLPVNPPPILSRMITLLADVNLTMDDIDVKLMEEFPVLVTEGWGIGSTRKKIKKYPLLARTAAEARMLLWRELGRSKIDGYRVISEAMDAEKVAADGSITKDHDIRMKAADRMLTLQGENVNPAGAKTNINISGEGQKILIMTADGKPAAFPVRDKETADGN